MQEFLSEIALNVALFACAALGWYASKWAGRRFSIPRKTPKLCKVDWEETCCDASQDTGAAEVADAYCVIEKDIAAGAVPAAVVLEEEAVFEDAADTSEQTLVASSEEDQKKDSSLTSPSTEPAVSGSMEEVLAEEGISFIQTPVSTDIVASKIDANMQSLDSSPPADVQPVEAVVSEKVAKIMAKKAARKARKAEEQKVLAQLTVADATGSEEAPQHAPQCDAEGHAVVDHADKVCLALEMDDIDVVAAPLVVDGVEPDEEPLVSGAATWSGPDSTSEQPELGEAGMTRLRSSAPLFEPAGRQRAWTEPAVTHPEQVEDEWMIPLEDMVGLSKEKDSQNGVVQALDPHINVFQPIMSEGGQQLYTDGQQVYMMAAMTIDTSTAPDVEVAPEPMITPVVDPCDPLHHAFMSLSAAVAMGVETPNDQASPWAARSPNNKAAPWATGKNFDSEEDDALWGVCWDFCS